MQTAMISGKIPKRFFASYHNQCAWFSQNFALLYSVSASLFTPLSLFTWIGKVLQFCLNLYKNYFVAWHILVQHMTKIWSWCNHLMKQEIFRNGVKSAQLLYGIYYILGLRNQLNFITTIFLYEFGTYHSLTERGLDQNSVIQTIYNCEAMKMDAGWYTAT